MSTERFVRRLAGTVVLVSLALGSFVDPLGYLLAAFVGVNLIQSTFTGVCPAETAYERVIAAD
ncbi:MAG: DUF2892 domain-containing protein [Haloferacaceae archaeon]|jgi:hypothetical protein